MIYWLLGCVLFSTVSLIFGFEAGRVIERRENKSLTGVYYSPGLKIISIYSEEAEVLSITEDLSVAWDVSLMRAVVEQGQFIKIGDYV